MFTLIVFGAGIVVGALVGPIGEFVRALADRIRARFDD